MVEAHEQVLVLGSVKWGRRHRDDSWVMVSHQASKRGKYIMDQKALKKVWIKVWNHKKVFLKSLHKVELLPIQQAQLHWMHNNSIFYEKIDKTFFTI